MEKFIGYNLGYYNIYVSVFVVGDLSKKKYDYSYLSPLNWKTNWSDFSLQLSVGWSPSNTGSSRGIIFHHTFPNAHIWEFHFTDRPRPSITLKLLLPIGCPNSKLIYQKVYDSTQRSIQRSLRFKIVSSILFFVERRDAYGLEVESIAYLNHRAMRASHSVIILISYLVVHCGN